VVDKVELVFYAQDEQVLKETDVTSSLYVIHSGTARVNKRRGVAPFQRIVTDLLQEGQHFGEMALVTGRDSGMDVKAKTDIMLYRVDRRLLEVLLGPVDTSLERGVYLQCLASIPMLENMSDGERVRMLDLFERQEFSSGESILSKGEEANSMYLLVKGIVAVMSVDELTKGDVEVTQITPVEYFGERALLENDARNAGVVVKSSSAVCLRLDRPSFNGAFGPVRHIMEREENVGSPLPRAGLDLRPMALVAEDQMGKIFIAEQMGVSSPSHGRSTKVFSFGNPLFGPTRRMVRCVPDRDRAEAMKEAHVRSGHHPFIVHFFGWFAEPPQTFLVTEHLEGISLYTLLHGPVPDDAKRVRNDRASSRFYAAAILSALSHLHEREIVFRALRPGAVILDWAGYPRLADFTCARQLKSGLAYTLCGRPDYLAPEAILGRGYDARADYWALGCLIYELIVGRPPFHNPQSSQNFAECTRCILRSEVPLDMRKEDGSLVLDPDCRNLVVELLRPSPLERAGCSRGDLDIRCSSWFENFAWEDLLERTMPPPWVPSEAFMSNRTKLQTQEAHSLTKPCDWTFGAANLGSPSSPH
jgi:cGMP-dependent protein kinase